MRDSVIPSAIVLISFMPFMSKLASPIGMLPLLSSTLVPRGFSESSGPSLEIWWSGEDTSVSWSNHHSTSFSASCVQVQGPMTMKPLTGKAADIPDSIAMSKGIAWDATQLAHTVS